MLQYGLKIWTTDKDSFQEALELFKNGEIDFAEIYIVPDSFLRKELKVLKKIPTIIHSVHESHNFNIFKLQDFKIELFKNQVVKTADFLKSRFIILHSGIGGAQDLFKKNIAKIYDKRILMENMPKIATDGKTCFGYSLEQLKFIKEDCRLNFCLDFGHAIKSAVSQKLDYKDYIKSLIYHLKPSYFHLAGGEKKNEKDEHLNLFEGDFDAVWIKKTLESLAKNQSVYLVFETPKSKNNLENDIKNIDYFKNLNISS